MAQRDRLSRLTLPQKKAIVALVLLSEQSRQAGFSRYEIGALSKCSGSSYPVKTMRAIQRAGYCQPVCDVALQLVESGQCRCGCDRWKPTAAGREYVATLNVRSAKRPPRNPLFRMTDDEQRRAVERMLGLDAQEGWKDGDDPPDFDPDSPSQRSELGDNEGSHAIGASDSDLDGCLGDRPGSS